MVTRESGGRKLEREILGRAGQGALFLQRGSRELALHQSLESGGEINTPVVNLLRTFVEKYIRSCEVVGALKVLSAVDTMADAHGADIIFCLESGEEKFFATVDIFSVPNHVLVDMVARRYPERFGWMDDDEEYKRWVVRNILITRYLQFQDDLYRLKSGLSFEDGEAQFSPTFFDREPNHFVLTPFDINRGRGLRALGREIAFSIARQTKVKKE